MKPALQGLRGNAGGWAGLSPWVSCGHMATSGWERCSAERLDGLQQDAASNRILAAAWV